MSSFLLKKKTKKSFLEGIQNLEYSTRTNYIATLKQFEKFCYSNYDKKSIQDVVDEIKSLKSEDKDEAFIGVMQDFVNCLAKSKLANTTIQKYYQIAIYYFSYNGIRVHPIELRQNVRIPKKFKEKLHPLTREEIIQLFKFTPMPRQMLYLVLIGSGMRIRETVALRKKDFDLDYPKRIKIEIPAQFTKTRTAHTTFVSKEAEYFLRPYLETLNDNDLAFATNSIPYHASMTEIEAFARYRQRAGLTAKYESTRRHHISLHTFRSYFFIRARRIHDTDVAHAMVGHTTYLDMYDRKEDSEKLELYLKVEPTLRIMN
ncbi:MAG: tyrosine-type recombinase/integrase [Nitrosarchaeum sp.]|jgi:integrase|uniref:tyrosine-type recombinase/integrase n=1 Tax=Nitrosarchaeum sp. TaxID=2026886 RepID=UPI002DEDF80F|nr:tyrosine-type recombinase/integrase [Nitrosarchaeum sp.]MEC4849107.1 tyrosine-type recombinase/integrase [Nitrosarchaeum sp.]